MVEVLLNGLRFFGQLLLEPLDCAGLVSHKKLKLEHLFDSHAFFVILGHLVGKKIHAFPFRKALGKSLVKLSCGERNSHAALNVKGHHAVEEQEVLPLGDDLGLAILGNENWELLQVGADEVPDTFFGAGVELETVFKTAIGFVSRDDEVLFDCTAAGDLLEFLVPLIKSPNISNHKTCMSARPLE